MAKVFIKTLTDKQTNRLDIRTDKQINRRIAISLILSFIGGSHDLLYQEFLPLLPSLLQGLNSLQSGLHKQHMKVSIYLSIFDLS